MTTLVAEKEYITKHDIIEHIRTFKETSAFNLPKKYTVKCNGTEKYKKMFPHDSISVEIAGLLGGGKRKGIHSGQPCRKTCFICTIQAYGLFSANVINRSCSPIFYTLNQAIGLHLGQSFGQKRGRNTWQPTSDFIETGRAAPKLGQDLNRPPGAQHIAGFGYRAKITIGFVSHEYDLVRPSPILSDQPQIELVHFLYQKWSIPYTDPFAEKQAGSSHQR